MWPLLLAPARGSQMPEAEQLNISLTPSSAAAPRQAILNDKHFPEVVFFFLHYKDSTFHLHKQVKGAVHSGLGKLAPCALIFQPEAENA